MGRQQGHRKPIARAAVHVHVDIWPCTWMSGCAYGCMSGCAHGCMAVHISVHTDVCLAVHMDVSLCTWTSGCAPECLAVHMDGCPGAHHHRAPVTLRGIPPPPAVLSRAGGRCPPRGSSPRTPRCPITSPGRSERTAGTRPAGRHHRRRHDGPAPPPGLRTGVPRALPDHKAR